MGSPVVDLPDQGMQAQDDPDWNPDLRSLPSQSCHRQPPNGKGLAHPEPEPALNLLAFEAPSSQTVPSEFADFSALSTMGEPFRPWPHVSKNEEVGTWDM